MQRFRRWGETPTMQNTKSNDSNVCKVCLIKIIKGIPFYIGTLS